MSSEIIVDKRSGIGAGPFIHCFRKILMLIQFTNKPFPVVVYSTSTVSIIAIYTNRQTSGYLPTISHQRFAMWIIVIPKLMRLGLYIDRQAATDFRTPRRYDCRSLHIQLQLTLIKLVQKMPHS
ncbi:hypothetical protein J2S19_002290 [Metabacillus malikii]|uniref:Uncharacterized protein n=1 Tax=Metabacillus malikii TaxID=1504265 RepID=A0ABT9ZFK3_9BACI|nr:hypothetical protein [Metabacillus malikii]